MKKSKTIEVRVCDFCIYESPQTWQCAKCEKDACARCCFYYRVSRSRPVGLGEATGTSTVLFAGTSQAEFTAYFCADCAKNEIPTDMLRAGFQDPSEAKTEVA